MRRPRTIRIGVVVPLSSLLSDNDAPGETADRSGCVPGETLREQIAEALDSNRGDQVLFTRLLTDDGGRLLDTTELGRYPSTRLAEAITHPRRHLPLPHLHRPRQPLRPRPPRTGPPRSNIGDEYRSVLPTTPPRQNLRLARLHQRRPRRRLDHARRRTLPMHRRTTTNRNGLRDQSWPEAE
jgi:hypothetical protein